MSKARIIWNGQGGELDSTVVSFKEDDDQALASALVKLVTGQIVTPGDSFIVEHIEA